MGNSGIPRSPPPETQAPELGPKGGDVPKKQEDVCRCARHDEETRRRVRVCTSKPSWAQVLDTSKCESEKQKKCPHVGLFFCP